MALKSIYEIEVDDSKFKEFQANFNSFQKTIKQSGKDAGIAGDKFERISDLVEMIAFNTSQSAKNQDKLRQATDGTNRSMSNLVRNTRDVSKGILEATGSLLKWTGIIGGIGMFGGLFGINRMIQGVVSQQNQSQRLVSGSPGQVNAFNVNYGQAFDAGSILSNVSGAQQSLNYKPFAALGMSEGQFKNLSAPDLAAALITAVRDFSQKNPNTPTQWWEATGVTGLMDMGSINQARRMSNLGELNRDYYRDRSSLELSPGVANQWGALGRQWDRSGIQIQNAAATALAPLAGPLKDLSDAIVKATRTLLGSDAFKGALDELAKGIRTFSGYLTSASFSADLADILDGLSDFGKMIKKIVGTASGDASEKLARSESRFGLRAGALWEIEKSGLGGAGRYGSDLKAYESRFASESNMFGALTKNPDSKKIRALVERVILGPELMQKYQATYGATWQSKLLPEQKAAINNMTVSIYNAAGADVSVSSNNMAMPQ